MSELTSVLSWSACFWAAVIAVFHNLQVRSSLPDSVTKPALFAGIIGMLLTYPGLWFIHGSAEAVVNAAGLPLMASTGVITAYTVYAYAQSPSRHLVVHRIASMAIFNNDKQIKRRCLKWAQETMDELPSGHKMVKELEYMSEVLIPRLIDKRQEEKTRIARLKSRNASGDESVRYQQMVQSVDADLSIEESVGAAELLESAKRRLQTVNAQITIIMEYLCNAKDIIHSSETADEDTLKQHAQAMNDAYRLTKQAGRERVDLMRESFKEADEGHETDLFAFHYESETDQQKVVLDTNEDSSSEENTSSNDETDDDRRAEFVRQNETQTVHLDE